MGNAVKISPPTKRNRNSGRTDVVIDTAHPRLQFLYIVLHPIISVGVPQEPIKK